MYSPLVLLNLSINLLKESYKYSSSYILPFFPRAFFLSARLRLLALFLYNNNIYKVNDLL